MKGFHMARSVNKVILIGNLGKDPEVRFSQNNAKIVTFSIATSESWKDRNSGERQERTEWHRVVVFDEYIANTCEEYLKKGNRVYLEGSLQTRKYEQDGVEKYTTEVVLKRFNSELVMLGGREDDKSDRFIGGNTDESIPDLSDNKITHTETDLEDEIPF